MVMNIHNAKLDVLLIGYEIQENLGLRSILSVLHKENITASIIALNKTDINEILTIVKKTKPTIIGFSIIFQFTLVDFAKIIKRVKEANPESHFTAGGHYPTLRPKETLNIIPELDSIVRHEGEYTIIELFRNINNKNNWNSINGIAFRKDEEIVVTPPRHLILNLDSLPFIEREQSVSSFSEVNIAHMLASRGCHFHCSFCSIKEFYGGARGPVRRTRSPQNVVDEMFLLYKDRGVKYFSFQDDDFSMRTKSQREWINVFLSEINKTELLGKIYWKISCRVDDISEDILCKMIASGLSLIYLGVETGNDLGLQVLNKMVTTDQNLKAINVVKKLGIGLSIGFMLFDPSSTFNSVKENLIFLEKAGSDGFFVINFCKMLPYAGTEIENKLKKEGRLCGSETSPDYELSDPKLDWFSIFVNRIFNRRNFQNDGLVYNLQQTDFKLRISNNIMISDNEKANFRNRLTELNRRANQTAIETLTSVLNLCESNLINDLLNDGKELVNIAEREWLEEDSIERDLLELNIEIKSN